MPRYMAASPGAIWIRKKTTTTTASSSPTASPNLIPMPRASAITYLFFGLVTGYSAGAYLSSQTFSMPDRGPHTPVGMFITYVWLAP